VYGITMVYSASAVFAAGRFKDDTYFLTRQLMFAGAGIVLLLGVRMLSPEWLRRQLRWVLFAGVSALVLVLIPGIGHVAGGARRWLPLGVAPLQPAEFAKLLVVLFMAHAIARRSEGRTQASLWTSALLAESLVVLVLLEPDFGTAVILQLMIVAMLFLGGARMGPLLAALIAAVPVAAYLIVSAPYRMRRVQAFLDPFADRRGAGYQLGEALISIGSGGITGVGLGDSRQKLYFLPEAHTDFIFAIIGEELGLLGIAVLVGLFAAYLYIAYRIAKSQTSPYRRALVLGLAIWLVLQAATNMAVATGLLPTKGLTLPFISSGGSSLLACCLATGLILAAAERPAGEVTP
jgi:cell division protein FtsW